MASYREYRKTPSAFAFMARAILAPSRPGLRADPPALGAAWRGHRAGSGLEDFLAAAGPRLSSRRPLLYPQAVGFRLQMTVLTDRSFPLPIWNSLQVRNRIILHREFGRDAALDFETRVTGQRVLEKGAEFDLHTTAHSGGELAWEGVNTFYYRGRYGAPGEPSPLAAAPRVEGPEIARWRMPVDGRLRFGRLTGDYNGIHLVDWYARRFGFAGAFLHSQRALAHCLAHLREGAASLPLRLDAWLKGPVFYGAEVSLRSSDDGFALHVNGDARPAIVGRFAR